jgi:hypothetical protein
VDGGRASEWWAPEVGLVKWIDMSIIGPRAWVLESFEARPAGEPFLRGDADGNGELAITDAIVTLEWLFLGGGPTACEDAADLNDDGGIDISDPVSLLAHLFLGSPPPPPPGPSAPWDSCSSGAPRRRPRARRSAAPTETRRRQTWAARQRAPDRTLT